MPHLTQPFLPCKYLRFGQSLVRHTARPIYSGTGLEVGVFGRNHPPFPTVRLFESALPTPTGLSSRGNECILMGSNACHLMGSNECILTGSNQCNLTGSIQLFSRKIQLLLGPFPSRIASRPTKWAQSFSQNLLLGLIPVS